VKVPRQAILGFAVLAAVCASVLIAAPAHSAGVSAKPYALKLLINGHRLPITQFGGPDRYTPVKAIKLRVVARWKSSLSGTGYKVVISTREPTVRTYRTCSTGTSCLVRKRVPILRGQEMSRVGEGYQGQAAPREDRGRLHGLPHPDRLTPS